MAKRQVRLGLSLALAVGTCGARNASAEVPSPSSPAAASVAAPLPSRDIRWSPTLGAAVDVGSMPRPSPGLALGFDVRRGALAARLVTSAFLPQRDKGSGASVGLFDAMAMICALAPVGSMLDIGACGGGGVGLLRASGPARAGGEQDTALRPQAVAVTRIDVALVRAQLFLSLEAGTVIAPVRSQLSLSTGSDVFQSALFSFRSVLSLDVRVW